MKAVLLAAVLACLACTGAQAQADETRLRALAAELRCPVCQNQSLADSDAELAADLRATIHQQIDAGRSDAEIRRFMVERYGHFVLYDPPFEPHTVPLWAGPFVLLAAAAAVLWWRIGRRWRETGARDEAHTRLDTEFDTELDTDAARERTP